MSFLWHLLVLLLYKDAVGIFYSPTQLTVWWRGLTPLEVTQHILSPFNRTEEEIISLQVILFLFFTAFIHWFFFHFSVPPKIGPNSVSKSNLSVILGSYLFIDCPATGIPPPTVTWLKNGEPIDFESMKHIQLLGGNRRLKISNAKLSDKGRYRCTAQNEAGKVKKQYDVNIHGKNLLRIFLKFYLINFHISSYLLNKKIVVWTKTD